MADRSMEEINEQLENEIVKLTAKLKEMEACIEKTDEVIKTVEVLITPAVKTAIQKIVSDFVEGKK